MIMKEYIRKAVPEADTEEYLVWLERSSER